MSWEIDVHIDHAQWKAWNLIFERGQVEFLPMYLTNQFYSITKI